MSECRIGRVAVDGSAPRGLNHPLLLRWVCQVVVLCDGGVFNRRGDSVERIDLLNLDHAIILCLSTDD